MSQSSMEDKIKEAGLQSKKGLHVLSPDEKAEHDEIRRLATDIWLYKWAKNSHQNYPLVMKSLGIKFLIEACHGMPAIVVGIGPSLDEAIPHLKKAQGRAVIIATDAAFRPLMAQGIKPSIVVSLDCKDEQGLVWESVPAHDVPMLFDVCASPTAIASWKGPVLFYSHYHESDEFSKEIIHNVYTHIGNLPSGGTVGNTAFVLTKALGCNIALCVGMDFCYKEVDGKWQYRAKDFKYEPADASGGLPARWVPFELKLLYDNDERLARTKEVEWEGKKYKTDPELMFYRQTFLGFIPHFKLNALNCSESGSLAFSTVLGTMALPQAIEQLCQVEFQGGRSVLGHLSKIV